MNLSLLSLLGFTLWTLFLLMATVGVYRWYQILAGTAALNSFGAGDARGDGWYNRAIRAHANCIENLPIFAVLVMAAQLQGLDSRWFDRMAVMVFVARIVHSLIHVCLVQTGRVVGFRFLFYSVQLFAFLAMAAVLMWNV